MILLLILIQRHGIIIQALDALNDLKKTGDVIFSYTCADTSLHRNGDTAHYVARSNNRVYTAYDALSFIRGERNPLYRPGSGRNVLNLLTAGWWGKYPTDAMRKVVQDAEEILGTDETTGHKGMLAFSFSLMSSIAMQKPELWLDILIQNLGTIRPLLEKGRLRFSLAYLFPGKTSDSRLKPFYEQNVLELFNIVLQKANFSKLEISQLLRTIGTKEEFYPLVDLGQVRFSPSLCKKLPFYVIEMLPKLPSYEEEIRAKPTSPISAAVRGNPEIQLMIVVRNGRMMWTPVREERRGDGPDALLVGLPGNLGVPIQDDENPDHYDHLITRNASQWAETGPSIGPSLTLQKLQKFIPEDNWFAREKPVSQHGKDHLVRTLILASFIADLIENDLSVEINREALLWAAVLHDIRLEGKESGKPREVHGKNAAEWVRNNLGKIDASVDVEFVATLCGQHDERDDRLPPQKSLELRILQDADALERMRLGKDSTGRLNTLFLNTVYGHQVIEKAREFAVFTNNQPIENVIKMAIDLGLLKN